MAEKPKTGSRGMVLVCMLVCVAIATSLVTATLQSALRARHELRLQRQLRQTELLLTAGLERAVARLRSDAAYSGEMWELDPATLPGNPPGRVRIEVTSVRAEESSSDRPGPRQIHVVARLSSGVLRGTQRSDTLILDIPAPPTEE
jgi:hypothetical protein